MKIAITSTGNSLESNIDQRFARCAYFVIYNTENKAIEFIPNPNKNKQTGAGPATVQFIASYNVNKIISGEIVANSKAILDSLKIQMILIKEPERKIKEIIDMLENS